MLDVFLADGLKPESGTDVGPISEKPPTDKEGVVRNRNCQLTRHVHWTQNHLQVPIHNLLSKL